MNACQFCGNDDATVEACLDCLGYSAGEIAGGLAVVLGGEAGTWLDVADAVKRAIDGDL